MVLYRVPTYLPCTLYRTHGKEPLFREPQRKHTATKKSLGKLTLRRVPTRGTRQTLDFAVCRTYSTRRSLSTCAAHASAVRPRDGAWRTSMSVSRRRLSRAITVPALVPAVWCFFFVCQVKHMAKIFAVCPIKSSRRSRPCRRYCSPWEVRREPHTTNTFAVRFWAFAVCLRHTANEPNPVVMHMFIVIHYRKRLVCRVPTLLSCAKPRAHNKELIYQVQ